MPEMWGKESLLPLGDMSMAEKKGFILYYDWEEYFDALESTEEVGELILALFAFAKRGEVEQFTGALKMAFTMMTRTIARDNEKWLKTCEERAIAGRKGGLAKASKAKQKLANDSKAKQKLANLADNREWIIDNRELLLDNNIEEGVSNETPPAKKTASKKFVKPSVDEIAEYIKEKQYGINAQQFYDFYESKGWKVGNSGMKDWKAAVRNWEQRRIERGAPAANVQKPQQSTGNPNASYNLDRWHEEADNMDFDALRKQMFGGQT